MSLETFKIEKEFKEDHGCLLILLELRFPSPLPPSAKTARKAAPLPSLLALSCVRHLEALAIISVRRLGGWSQYQRQLKELVFFSDACSMDNLGTIH
jgi:hypothetical protein